MPRAIRVLLGLTLVLQSSALSISVSSPLIPGEEATSTWTRTPDEPSEFVAAIRQTNEEAQRSHFSRFLVNSHSQLTWDENTSLPSDFPLGSYVIQAFAPGSKTVLATSNSFNVAASDPPNSSPLETTTTTSVVALTTSVSSPDILSTTVSSSVSPNISPQAQPVTPQVSPESTPVPNTSPLSSETDSSPTPSPSVSGTQSNSSSIDAPAIASDTSSSSSHSAVIAGSVIAAIIAVVILLLLAIFFLRRYRRRRQRESVDFFDRSHMVRSPINLDQPYASASAFASQSDKSPGFTNSYSMGYTDQTPSPHELPAYGYSNYDVIEKADHFQPSRSPLPAIGPALLADSGGRYPPFR